MHQTPHLFYIPLQLPHQPFLSAVVVVGVVAHSSVTQEEINFQSLHQQPKRNGHRHQWPFSATSLTST